MDVVMPQLGETVKEGTVTAWHKKVGERVERDERLFEVNTDKVDTDVPAPVSGVVTAILVATGETVKVGARVAVIEEAGREEGEARLSPVVRKLLAEHGLDAAGIAGSGAGGRITRNDVLEHLEQRKAAAPSAAAPDRTRLPLSRIRRRTGEQMSLAWRTIPHVLQAIEVDFQAVEQARLTRAAAWKAREGWSLTYLPFVAHAVCAAMRDFPAVNATLDGEALLLHQRINLGFAVDLGEEGLTVPVVKDAAARSLDELARAIHFLSERARARQLKPDDVTEATYTISNSGKFDTLLTAPIVNPPQVAILSMDGVAKKPVVVEGPGGDMVVIRPVGVLAQSFDHRAFDGAYSGAFLRRLKEILEGRDWSSAF